MDTPYKTLGEVFLDRTSAEHRHRPYLYYKPDRDAPYKGVNNGEFGDRVTSFAKGLNSLGVRRGDRIALISESRPEWVITDFAALCLGAISVPMFPTSTAKQVEQILAHSGASVVVVSNDFQLDKVIKSIPRCTDLKHIIVMNEEWNTNTESFSTHRFFEILIPTLRVGMPNPDALRPDLTQSVEVGHSHAERGNETFDLREEVLKALSDDVVTIIYTSGTTGVPKGVMLTHNNLISNVEGALGNIPPIGINDCFLSFLPISHGFERIASYLVFFTGAQVAYAESIERVADNMLEVRPTVITGVPRFYERIYGRLMRMRDKMPPMRKKIFDWALRVGAECARKLEGEHPKLSAILARPVADALVLSKIRARTGGHIRFFISGGAALPEKVGKAFAAFGMIVLEGYGMTESSPIISVTKTDKIQWGSVGKPIPNVEVRIADDGEILTRGPHVMKGYYRSPQETDEVIDTDGWLHTGDIGVQDSEGFLKITDRKKNLFVSEGGKNIAPAPIESLLQRSSLISQVILFGDNRPYCTALVVPDFEIVQEELGLSGISDNEMALREDVRALFEKELQSQQKELASYEKARRFALLGEPFTIENGMMTPTLKIKRKEVEARYGDVVERMYRELR